MTLSTIPRTRRQAIGLVDHLFELMRTHHEDNRVDHCLSLIDHIPAIDLDEDDRACCCTSCRGEVLATEEFCEHCWERCATCEAVVAKDAVWDHLCEQCRFYSYAESMRWGDEQ